MALALSLPAPPVLGVLLALAVATLTSGQCPQGQFGAGCRHLCHCVQDSACDVSRGECTAGCQVGYSGPWCQRRNVALGARVEYRSHGIPSRIHPRIVDSDDLTCDLVHFHSQGFLNITLNVADTVDNIAVSMLISEKDSQDPTVKISTGNGICAQTRVTFSKPMLLKGCEVNSGYFTMQLDGNYNAYVCEVEAFVCESGFHGAVCDQLCGHCRNGGCDQESEACAQGCEAGYTGYACNQPCDAGTYGQNCTNSCGHCLMGLSCDPINGTCADGCEGGYTGSRCEDACVPGRYGHACSRKCGHCGQGGPCDAVSGSCPDGCEAGYAGAGCQEKCASGTFGSHCSSQCGQCRQGAACDSITGSCPDGCEAGFAGGGCHQKCQRETYGENCSRACPVCDLGATCHHVTGACPQTSDRLGAGVVVAIAFGVAVCVALASVSGVVAYLVRKRYREWRASQEVRREGNSAYLTPVSYNPWKMNTRKTDDKSTNADTHICSEDNHYESVEMLSEDIETST